MKRYLVFAGAECYPQGGWGDFKGDFASLKDAQQEVAQMAKANDWTELVDLYSMKIIEKEPPKPRILLGSDQPEWVRDCRGNIGIGHRAGSAARNIVRNANGQIIGQNWSPSLGGLSPGDTIETT